MTFGIRVRLIEGMAKESSKNVGASIPKEDRGRDESRHEGASKNLGKSKDLLSSLEKRLPM